MNLSETAFLLPRDSDFSLRWFTPATEVALCGHATLASAHALWEEKILAPTESARFHTKSGLLTGERKGDRIELDFRSEEHTSELQSQSNLVCRLLLEKKKKNSITMMTR